MRAVLHVASSVLGFVESSAQTCDVAGLGELDAQHTWDGDDSFCSSTRTGLHAAPPLFRALLSTAARMAENQKCSS